MNYYHGSREKGLKRLEVKRSKDGYYVWLTDQYEYAVFYAGNNLRFRDYNSKTNKLVIKEVAENCFEKLYKGVDCYIYVAKDIGEFEVEEHFGRRAIRCHHDVDLEFYEYVPDVYDKIMQLYHKGVIELKFWNDYTKEEKKQEINSLKQKFNKKLMLKIYKNQREDYNKLIELIPELKLKIFKNNKNMKC